MVSVIITTRNRRESLERCLASIKKSAYLRSFEVVVIDSGDGDNSAVFSMRKNVKYFHFLGDSLSKARQFGFEKAMGAILIYIDDDTEVTKDWLENILAPFKDKNVGGVSGPTIVPKEKLKNRDVFMYSGLSNLRSLGFLSRMAGWIYRNIILEGREKEVGRICKSGMWTMGSNFYKVGAIHESPVQEVDYLEACNMAFRRSLIEKAGGFDLGFLGTSEWSEVDLAFRIKVGAIHDSPVQLVFNPKAVLYHHVSCEGVFGARVNAKVRMENFLRYWFKNRKIIWNEEGLSHLGSLSYLSNTIRFLICVGFWNGYWVYKAITTRNIRWIGGVLGTATGLWKNI